MPTRTECLPIRGCRSVREESLSSSFAGGLLLDYRSLVGLFAGHIRHHQFSQFHELLDLLFGDVTQGVECFQTAIGPLKRRSQRIHNSLLALKLLTLKSSRTQRAESCVERSLGPVAVLEIIRAGIVAVARIGLPKKLI